MYIYNMYMYMYMYMYTTHAKPPFPHLQLLLTSPGRMTLPPDVSRHPFIRTVGHKSPKARTL